MRHELPEDVLLRLVGEGLYALLGGSDRLVARMVPGGVLALSGASAADLNGAIVWGGEAPEATLRSFAADAEEAGAPFLLLLGPDLAEPLAPLARELGLVHATEFPIMVCSAAGLEPAAPSSIEVARLTDPADMPAWVAPTAAAFQLDPAETSRAIPFSWLQGPVTHGWTARIDGRVVSAVITTVHGDHVGIWAMATHPDHQRKGTGQVLLTHVMDEHRRRGAEAFFLGATPAGKALYGKIGYDTRVVAQVWVRGETAQA
jgi:GNAT superfamily N-acetyltransferase